MPPTSAIIQAKRQVSTNFAILVNYQGVRQEAAQDGDAAAIPPKKAPVLASGYLAKTGLEVFRRHAIKIAMIN